MDQRLVFTPAPDLLKLTTALRGLDTDVTACSYETVTRTLIVHGGVLTEAAIRDTAATVPTAAPRVPLPRASLFAAAIHLGLVGNSADEKYQRGLALRRKRPDPTTHLINDLRLAGTAASPGAMIAVQLSWESVRTDRVIGIDGIDPDHLTTAEVTAITELAREYDIELT